MTIALTCACGARLEVEETLAGQTVRCPDCQSAIKVKALEKGPVRTSGYALASTIFALVFAFTVAGTILAVLLGLLALVSIARHRERVAGTGYAILGIVAGLIFTAISLFAFSEGELFNVPTLREQLMSGQIDKNGPLEIIREKDGFAITRPSEKWGVARRQYMEKQQPESSVMLVHLRRDAYLTVVVDPMGRRSLNQYREAVLENFRNAQDPIFPNRPKRPNDFKLRSVQSLPRLQGLERQEVEFDVKVLGQNLRYLVRMLYDPDSDRVYTLSGWTLSRRFSESEADLRQAMDSFRVLVSGE